MPDFSTTLRDLRTFISNLEDRRFTQKHLAELCFVSLAAVNRWERGDEPDEKSLRLVADGISRYFGNVPLAVTVEDLRRPDFVDWVKAQILAVRRGDQGGATATYSERSLRQLFAQEDLMQVLGLTEQGQRWLEGKLARYRSNLTVEDWMDVIAKQKLGTLEQDEWQFTDARVVTARLHFKSDRPLTEQERRTAERAAQEALETYWLKQQAERKEPK